MMERQPHPAGEPRASGDIFVSFDNEEAALLFRQELRMLLSLSASHAPMSVISQVTGIPASTLSRIRQGRWSDIPSRTAVSELLTLCNASPEQSHRALSLWEAASRQREAGESPAKITVVSTRSRPRPAAAAPAMRKLREDVEGYEDLKPNPLAATTKEEFLQCMRDFHIWAKQLSYREIALRSGRAVGASTLCSVLNPHKPPRLPSIKVVEAFIIGCGGSEEDLDRWTTAWRLIRMPKPRSTITSSASYRPLHPQTGQPGSL